MRKYLTDESVKATKCPEGQNRLEVYDTQCPNLVLRVSASAKTWMFYFRHEGRFQKLTIGNALAIPLADARRKVNDLSLRVRAGADPRATAADAPKTFRELAERFFEQTSRSTVAADRAMLNHHVMPVLGDKRILALAGPDFARLKEGIIAKSRKAELDNAKRLGRPPKQRAGERISDRVNGVCKTIMRWGLPLGYISADLTLGIKRSVKSTEARRRVLTDVEVVSFLRALPKIFSDEQRQIMAHLILLLGCRKSEMSEARVGEFYLEGANPEWRQPGERVKNRHDHVVPLCPKAVHLVQRALAIAGPNSYYLFPSPETGDPFEATAIHKVLSRAFKAGGTRFRDEKSGLYRSVKHERALSCPPFTMHDLRRTAATGMSRLGVPIAIIGKTLNHRSADQSVTGLVYNVHDFAAEKRAALKLWADHVEGLMGGVGKGM